jgi:hypothetical protein
MRWNEIKNGMVLGRGKARFAPTGQIITLAMLLTLLISGLGLLGVAAQEVTDEPQAPGDLPTITEIAPLQVVSGEGGILSVFGTDFEADTTVFLEGIGLLETEFINSGALRATLPMSMPRGEYEVGIIRPDGSPLLSGLNLTVRRAPSAPATDEPEPTATVEPTVIPGQPSLIVRSFLANPSNVIPGGTVAITFEIVNQGNRIALGPSVTLSAGGKFAPAGGQAGATLPDIGQGASYTVTLNAIAAMDTPAGPNAVGIKMNYRDFEGKIYDTEATLTVNVGELAEASQVTLARYLLDPNPVEPGEPVTVTVLVTNTGNDLASQVLLRVAGTDSVLLAGPQGDSFPVGDLAPGASASLELPMVVSKEADAGPQPQPLTITYLQKGESKENPGSMTIQVADVVKPEALLLLESYNTGQDVLKPGDRFTLSMTLQNAGEADAANMLVTFGTVDSTDPGNDNDDSSGDNGSTVDTGSSTSTTPSSTFAPLGAGGTMFVGTLNAGGGSITLEQDFIVNGTVDSGIYNLPITIRYTDTDGENAQENLKASVVVVKPPQLRVTLLSPIPESVNTGEPVSVGLDIINTGNDIIRFTTATVETENAEILDGAEVFLGSLDGEENTSVNATVMPLEEGRVSITVSLNYIDDLNREQAIVNTYETEAMMPPPLPEDLGPPIDVMPTPTPEPSNDALVGQILLGLLGLGS